ncbi:MAG: heterodisulfide reductase-related iron-sulfur binding cluster [Armatimonadota bacterium]|nr:heterodisulfide reductase-related iron-sulfur binding cluster [Armatimonadota bacterium]MDR7467300.1 heterodisulfide reductase-related iron-sulfur binding cluster [Armatimonadota bacterium]MDR7494561.1 heterodisulfide reductase-related iron-sulfur binding cluster [Armatimonadota bacterium]MDR7504472.1 heterodisulfide reductase-related iron-sulfur binding cluster [Armatimonadota bacterium]MDR7553413.1 heterodisulfide reductase-related iron-sulfur binding cluster [Armatimonadota bacterium]
METAVGATHLPLPRPAARGRSLPALLIPELDQCVHCGLCLPQCPTYRVTALETESPRGRIHLVRAAGEGRIAPGARFAEHIYLCLMCRACETACPSGVKYGRIAEAARAVLGPPGSPLGRATVSLVLRQVFPFPRRLRLLARLLRFYQRSGLRALARLLPGRLRQAEALLPPIPAEFFTPEAEVLPALGPRRARIGLLQGCVMPLLFGAVNAATVRVLRRNGCEVVIPGAQGCCGALNLHNGETVAMKAMARRNIDVFLNARVDAVVVNAAGCGAAMKEYGHLLRDDPAYAEKAAQFSRLVQDASEFLADLGLVGPLGPVPLTVTYQDPCHLAHGQKVRAQPRRLLTAIPGLRLVEMEASDRCCGSAGIYNVTHAAMSGALLEEKLVSIERTGAEAVVAPNPGCMVQLLSGVRRRGLKMPVYHLLDLLDRAYETAGAAAADGAGGTTGSAP